MFPARAGSKAGKECMFVGKGVISLGKENLMII